MSTTAQVQQKVVAQKLTIKELKTSKAEKSAIKAAVNELLALTKQFDALYYEENKEAIEAQKAREKLRAGVENVAKRNFIWTPSAEIHGGCQGLFDFGPAGCAIKNNLINLWKRHFILEESMLEVECSTLTPAVVLQTSGHVDKFEDFMVKDVKTLECHRADHLLEAHIDQLLETDTSLTPERRVELKAIHGEADAYTCEQLGHKLIELGIKAPETGNDISAPYPFNLMFGTMIGPTGKLKGYLRPETAQGIFTNFKKLLEFNNQKMPFAAAQVGLAFRNEISPRSGLLRVREFTLAEIEHFCERDSVEHPKFDRVRDVAVVLLSSGNQDGNNQLTTVTIGEAIDSGLVTNQTLGYYMARTQLLLEKCGIKRDKLRFRQHKDDEMAHYAKDCWDAEIHTTFGWVECVGHADRSCFDLEHHAAATKTPLSAQITYAEPKIIDVLAVKANKGVIGKTFRKEAKAILDHFKTMSLDEGLEAQQSLDANGEHTFKLSTGDYNVTKAMVTFAARQEKVSVETYTPSVVEPSFGIGRILYCILEHAYSTRHEDEQRVVLSLTPLMAPYKCAVLPLSNNAQLKSISSSIYEEIIDFGCQSKIDDSSVAIGRKYARSDEMGTPFAITVDFRTVEDKTVTIRERDSCEQIRVRVSDAAGIVNRLAHNRLTWAQCKEQNDEFQVDQVAK